jgi:hypothetical protein
MFDVGPRRLNDRPRQVGFDAMDRRGGGGGAAQDAGFGVVELDGQGGIGDGEPVRTPADPPRSRPTGPAQSGSAPRFASRGSGVHVGDPRIDLRQVLADEAGDVAAAGLPAIPAAAASSPMSMPSRYRLTFQ